MVDAAPSRVRMHDLAGLGRRPSASRPSAPSSRPGADDFAASTISGGSFSRMVELEEGVRRTTFRIPFGIDHVHCYFLRLSGGGWMLVDTGLGSRDPEARWGPVLAELDAPVERIVITHMHPDHVGGARDIAGLTGAPVLQGRLDYEQCVRAWGLGRSPARF